MANDLLSIAPRIGDNVTVQIWSSWKRFPNALNGDSVEAPIGPGVYEVRHTPSGSVVAFGHAANVANALAELKVDGGGNSWTRLFRRDSMTPQVHELEYRTCAAASRAEAKVVAERMKKLRSSYWRKRLAQGRAARHWPSG
jgi:hypothetical protein